MNISLTDSLCVGADVVFRQLDDEAVLLNLQTGSYFGLDPVGTRIWLLIIQHGSLARILAAMVEEYAADPEVIERDLLELSRQFCTKGLADLKRF
jgi:hypothetical protein